MSPRRVLAVGLDPAAVDPAEMGGLDPALVRAFIDQQLNRVRSHGYVVDACLVEDGDEAIRTALRWLTGARYDCVLIGAGLRAESRLLLLERLLNLVHEHAPGARICFNSSPEDSTEAVRRWV